MHSSQVSNLSQQIRQQRVQPSVMSWAVRKCVSTGEWTSRWVCCNTALERGNVLGFKEHRGNYYWPQYSSKEISYYQLQLSILQSKDTGQLQVNCPSLVNHNKPLATWGWQLSFVNQVHLICHREHGLQVHLRLWYSPDTVFSFSSLATKILDTAWPTLFLAGQQTALFLRYNRFSIIFDKNLR